MIKFKYWFYREVLMSWFGYRGTRSEGYRTISVKQMIKDAA